VTYRDPEPHPTCPYCAGTDVSRDTFGQNQKRQAYLCAACWSVFDGSADEWLHHTEAREALLKRRGRSGLDQG
jgi:transposase-like protein